MQSIFTYGTRKQAVEMKQKGVYLQNPVQHVYKNVWRLSVSWKRTSFMFCTAAICFHHKHLSLFTKQSRNLQSNSPLGVKVNSYHIHTVYFELLKNLVV